MAYFFFERKAVLRELSAVLEDLKERKARPGPEVQPSAVPSGAARERERRLLAQRP